MNESGALGVLKLEGRAGTRHAPSMEGFLSQAVSWETGG